MYGPASQFLVISYLAQCGLPNEFTSRPMHLKKAKGVYGKFRPKLWGHIEISTVSQNELNANDFCFFPELINQKNPI
jgi:hypothetical protein